LSKQNNARSNGPGPASRAALASELSRYRTPYAGEQRFVSSFKTLLASEGCYRRDHLPGHVTASAFIVNRPRTKTLLLHHAKLGRWLQPGGHADGDERVLEVALREAREETGLESLNVLSSDIFDIDIHVIPKRQGVLEHLHYDVRFLLEADESEPLKQNEESLDLSWIDLGSIERHSSEPSILRMRDKAVSSLF
jgi:8-oxo-dGTP pyrophosphatase MutT (NUDIX family)